MGCIYGHRCKITDKWYIGQTIKSKPEYRWGVNGNGYLKRNPNSHFARAIKKYGWENFEHVIFEYNIPNEDLDEMEKAYIEKYNSVENGYNSTYGGGANHEVSEETKRKNSEISKKMWENNRDKLCSIYSSKEHRKKLSEAIKKAYEEDPKIKEKLSNNAKQLIWVCNENGVERINKKDFEQYKENGYQQGMNYISLEIGRNIIYDYTVNDLSIGDIMVKYNIVNRKAVERYLKEKNIELKNKSYLTYKKTKGLPKTEEFKKIVSESSRKSRQGKIWVNNGITSKSILKEDLEKYLEIGWQRGRGKINTENMEHNESKKRILCVETNKIYFGIKTTARFLNIPLSTLKAALKFPNKTAGGYHWKYVD